MYLYIEQDRDVKSRNVRSLESIGQWIVVVVRSCGYDHHHHHHRHLVRKLKYADKKRERERVLLGRLLFFVPSSSIRDGY